ncbi:hypothetical protein ID866_2234 [Astraeus odoratus]|nr:hypothetical protein ID866_2234 [Astraeus odoratus]
MAPSRKCPICSSTQWRKDSASGMVACGEGHVLQNYRTESGDAEDYGAHTMKKRTLRSTRKNKQNTSRADPELYHGERARFHYYLCLQVLLRKQIAALTTLWNLPPEFEIICRDLWVLHLNLLPSPPPAETFYHTEEMKGGSTAAEAKTHEVPRGGADGPRNGDPKQRSQEDSDSGSSSEEDKTDRDLEDLLQEDSEDSSTDDEIARADSTRLRKKSFTSGSGPFVDRSDRPGNTIAVLVLACWTIRLPVMYMDFINAIENHSIPYLDNIRLLPEPLTRHLTKHAIQALSPHHAPKTSLLHRLASRLANRLYSNFSVSIPELNAAPVLWRAVRQCFCGTPMLYLLTKQLSRALSLPISLHQLQTPSHCGDEMGAFGKHGYDNIPPEAAIVGAVIIALKLVYGLDGMKRLPRDMEDAAYVFPDVNEFLGAVKQANCADQFINSHPFSARIPVSVGDLNDATLDKYLDFCEKVLVGPQGNEQRILDNYFPLTNGSAEDGWIAGIIDPMTNTLSSMEMSADGSGVLRSGESYTIYHSADILGNLPSDLDLLITRASRWAGVGRDDLCGAVERYERRLVRWWHTERQREGKRRGDDA